ncbi:MAG: hypothetical protein AAGF31_13820, partial [Planctomycetota bacterium]
AHIKRFWMTGDNSGYATTQPFNSGNLKSERFRWSGSSWEAVPFDSNNHAGVRIWRGGQVSGLRVYGPGFNSLSRSVGYKREGEGAEDEGLMHIYTGETAGSPLPIHNATRTIDGGVVEFQAIGNLLVTPIGEVMTPTAAIQGFYSTATGGGPFFLQQNGNHYGTYLSSMSASDIPINAAILDSSSHEVIATHPASGSTILESCVDPVGGGVLLWLAPVPSNTNVNTQVAMTAYFWEPGMDEAIEFDPSGGRFNYTKSLYSTHFPFAMITNV